ncbi:hypothetical protein Tco_0954470 [Tanacetum coccineum]|uniref:Uncharacterized protein n=1 Tax=Tanacetum coccineum TaxID=301880 RepID=A0ABQ5E2U0_9ASTR
MVVGDQILTSGIRAQGIDSKGFLEFFDCPGSRQGVEDLREVKHRKARWEYCTKAWRFKVGFKQLGPGVETGIHEVHDEKRVLFEVELQGAHGDREAEVFQVSNDDTAVAQRWLEDKQPKEKTNTDCLVKEQEKECQTGSKCNIPGYHTKVKVGDKLWRLDDVTSKVVLYRNMRLNKSEEYRKTFIGFSIGLLQGVEFGVEPQEDHTFEVEPHGNVDHVAGSHWMENTNQGFNDLSITRDREQHSSRELFRYREDSNEVAFAVLLLRSGLPRVCWIKQREMYLKVNGQMSYAVESQVYQGVCTRPNIASADVGMYNSWEARMPHMMALLTTEAGCMTFIKAWKKEAIWLRGLLEELGVELNRVAVNCDNQGAIHLSRNHVFHERNKHINVRYHFIREVLEAKAVKV